MDVVPTTNQPWDTDPFQLVEKGSRLYGRGTTDMKGYLACMLASVPAFQARALKMPIHLLFSYDEEVGCTGVVPMVEQFGKSLPKPEIVLVGEPSMMTVVDGHKGGARFRTDVTGKDAHSSTPAIGVSAIFVASDLMAELRRMEARMKISHPAPRFDPPFPTITVSFISGGIAHNIIPPRCSFDWGVRLTPGVDTQTILREFQAYAEHELLPAMRAVHPDCAITTELLGLLPAFTSGENSPATSLAMKLAGQNATHTVPYGTEASHFQAAGCSSVVIGPGHIAQAHQPNEFIETVELDNCMAFLVRVRDWAAA
jgi:acetylornithine deacetylase